MATLMLRARVAPEILVQELEGEAVFLNLKSGRYFGLDSVGTRIWHMLTTAPSVQAAREALLAEYDVAEEILNRDLQELLDQLVAHGLVELRGNEVE